MKTYIMLIALAVAVFGSAQRACAQASSGTSSVWMEITGSDGPILGEVTLAGREGWNRLYAYTHEIVSPRDPATGLATGKRQHHPFRVVKLLNRNSPLLLTAMTKNETFPTIRVLVFGPSAGGAEVLVLVYRLNDASIASIRPWMPNKSDPNTREYPPAEEISFTYKSIEVIFQPSNITGQDNWDSSSAAAAAPK